MAKGRWSAATTGSGASNLQLAVGEAEPLSPQASVPITSAKMGRIILRSRIQVAMTATVPSALAFYQEYKVGEDYVAGSGC